MKDQKDKHGDRLINQNSGDFWSEWLFLLVASWIAAMLLLPLHVLAVYNIFYTGSPFALVVLFTAFVLPLAVVDVLVIRWFQDNFSVFRWTNRFGDSSTDESLRR